MRIAVEKVLQNSNLFAEARNLLHFRANWVPKLLTPGQRVHRERLRGSYSQTLGPGSSRQPVQRRIIPEAIFRASEWADQRECISGRVFHPLLE